MKSPHSAVPSVTFRSITLGILLIPINCYWIIYTEMVWWGLFPTTMSLFFNVIFCLLIVTLLNLAVQKYKPTWALSQGELLVVYIMLCMASSVASHDRAQVLISSLGHAFWFATPENEWQELFHQYIPRWLTVQDKQVLEGYYRGESTFHQIEVMRAWLSPALWWTSFIGVMLFVMICLNTFLRKQWTERERLAYPIIELPFAMTEQSGSKFFTNRLFWLAFSLVAVLNVINGLHHLFPAVPLIGVRLRDVSYLFTEKPWNAIGWTPFSIYPFVIGLGFFMPLDLSFSCWFFYLFRKSQRVFGAMLGIRALPGFPYDHQQSLGAYLGLSVFAIWAARRYVWSILKQVFGRARDLDDSEEPMSYRAAAIGTVLGLAYLIGFTHQMGLNWWLAVAFFGIYYTLSVGITRMRVESGAPAHDLHYMGAGYTLSAVLGTRRLGGQNLASMSLLYFFNRAHRSHAMPHQLEGFKLAERGGFRRRPLVFAMLLAVLVGSLSSFWAYLHDVYRFGSGGGFGWEPFNRLQQQLNYPTTTNVPEVTFIGVGFFFSLLLMFLRIRFIWWPFHAVGYAVSGADDWCMNWLWVSLVISTTLKWVILKYGGLRTHRKAAPFFLGLVLGEFVLGSFWSIYGIVAGTTIFPFKDW